MGDKVSLNEKKIIEIMADNPNIRKPELAKLIGLGKTSIDNYIERLKRSGRIERIGSNKTGYWKVNR